MFWFCHLCVHLGAVLQAGSTACGLHGVLQLQVPPGLRMDLPHPAGLPAKDTASQPGHTAQKTRAVLNEAGKALPHPASWPPSRPGRWWASQTPQTDPLFVFSIQ